MGQVLVELLEAAQIMDEIFLVQVAADNPEAWRELESSTHALGAPARGYFAVNFGPWDRLAGNEPFVYGVDAKPAGANLLSAAIGLALAVALVLAGPALWRQLQALSPAEAWSVAAGLEVPREVIRTGLAGVDDAAIRKGLLERFGIEIGRS